MQKATCTHLQPPGITPLEPYAVFSPYDQKLIIFTPTTAATISGYVSSSFTLSVGEIFSNSSLQNSFHKFSLDFRYEFDLTRLLQHMSILWSKPVHSGSCYVSRVDILLLGEPSSPVVFLCIYWTIVIFTEEHPNSKMKLLHCLTLRIMFSLLCNRLPTHIVFSHISQKIV